TCQQVLTFVQGQRGVQVCQQRMPVENAGLLSDRAPAWLERIVRRIRQQSPRVEEAVGVPSTFYGTHQLEPVTELRAHERCLVAAHAMVMAQRSAGTDGGLQRGGPELVVERQRSSVAAGSRAEGEINAA